MGSGLARRTARLGDSEKALSVNFTMLTYGRPELTRQSLDSLEENTPKDLYNKATFCSNECGTGQARNLVIGMSKNGLERGEYLYLSDNDVCFLPRWLETLIECYEWARETHGVIAMGAYCHPYMQPYQKLPFYSTHAGRTLQIGLVHALPLQSWLWKWEDWDRFGPFDQTPVGRVRMSEDVAVSNKIKEAGGKVAAIYPPLIVNCGVTDSFGQPIPGADVVMQEHLPEGVIRL